jgi:hypothetical protein
MRVMGGWRSRLAVMTLAGALLAPVVSATPVAAKPSSVATDEAAVAATAQAEFAEACSTANTDPVDLAYPLKEVLCLLSGPEADLRTPGMLQFLIDAEILTTQGNLTQAFEDLLDPDTYTGPDRNLKIAAAGQKLWDAVIHLAPFSVGLPPNPDYLPDWDHDGVFGQDLQDVALDDDYSTASAQTATFRYPCINTDGSVFYETTSGSCVAAGTAGATFKLGTVKKFKIVDSRGMAMAAKVWLPQGAESAGRKYPVTVMAPGASEKQIDVAMYTEAGVRRGFVGITFAQAGQPASEGTALDVVTPVGSVEHCFAPGSCRDFQDAVRWVKGDAITPVVSLWCEACNVLRGFPYRSSRRNPAYSPSGENVRNPWASLMDLSHINIWGQSVGSIGATSYLYWQGKGYGIDGRSLPKVSAGVGLSGFTAPGTANVPFQLQTADFDIPGVFADGFVGGIPDATDGPVGTKAQYDQIRATRRGNGALQMIVLEGGSHGDSINWPFVPRGVWGPAISTGYAVDFFACYGQATADAAACARLKQPVPHLSRAVANEIDPDGPAGPSPSLCMNLPDRATLEQLLLQPITFYKNWTGDPQYDCTPQP